MLVLDTTTKTMTAAMAGAATTTNPAFVTAYSDDTGTSFVEGSSDGALSGSSQVTLVAAPAASTRRLIKTIYIANTDTVANTITVTLNDNGTLRVIAKVTLQVGDTWSTDGTTDINGALKTTVGSVNLANVTGTLGVINGGTGVTASTGASSVVLRDTNANITANSITPGWTSTATAAGTTTLTVASTYYQRFTGSTTQTVVLPSATTVALGQGFIIDNDSSGNLTLQDGSAGALGSVVPGMAAFVFCENNSTTAGSWSGYMFVPGGGPSGQVTWGTAGLSMGGQTISSSTWNGSLITGTYGGTGVNNGSNTITLGGSLTTSGAFTTTFTATANTSVTLPTTGTLATLAGSETFTNKTLTNPTVTAYLETAPSITNSSTAVTLSLSSGTVLSYTLTGNCTFTMPTATSGTSFIVKLIQDGTGSRTATFTGVKWPGGTAPTITTTATTGLDILSFVCINSVWYGTAAQAFA